MTETSDLRLGDVVAINKMIGPDGRYVVGICETCSKRFKVYKDEYTDPRIHEDFLEYAAKMKAWQCCHTGKEPLDGYPEP